MTIAVPEDLTEHGPYFEAYKLLEYAKAAALDANTDLPERQYITIGQAVYDCEQIVSTLSIVTTGMPGGATGFTAGIANCPLPWQLTVDLAIVRCHPGMDDDGSPPSVEALLSASRLASVDTRILQAVGDSRASEQFGQVAVTISYPPPSGDMRAVVGRYTVAMST